MFEFDYNSERKLKREVRVGNIKIGGKNKISVQSMTNTDTHNFDATYSQIKRLSDAGCDIVRITVPDISAAETVRKLKESDISVPIVADIHFDYRIALKCAEYGVDKIRINPGNIGDGERIKAVADACRTRGIPIRVGVNSGSVEKHLLEKYGRPSPEALCESALLAVKALEKYDFYDTVVSIKASNVPDMIRANRLVSEKCDNPLHIGVTEAGSTEAGTIKNAVGIGSLLCNGIGDTLRVSLTADPVFEVAAARKILSAVGIKGQCGMDIVSCPTCGRTKIDLIGLSKRFEEAARAEGLLDLPIKVALMGCVVNGPGEAKEADIGIAGGEHEAVLISHGEVIGKIPEDKIIETLVYYIKTQKERYL